MSQPTPPPPPLGHRFPELATVMARLLAPDGCPWDREQTLETLRPFLIEEGYEVIDALERGDVAGHQEELGDLLMQVVFHAAIRQAAGAFDVDDVIGGICAKLIHRHPHIFGDARGIETSSQVLAQWEDIKAAEKRAKAAGGTEPRTLDGVPRGLPALARAQKLGSKAGKVGFDWGGWQGSMAKVEEEVREVAEAATARDQAAAHHEIGDLLFAVVNLARKLDVDAETALADSSSRFRQRFEYIEDRLADGGRKPKDSSLEEMDALWNQAKVALKKLSPRTDGT